MIDSNLRNEEYRQFAGGRRDLPLFCQPWWLDHLAPGWEVLICRRGDRLQGVWPLFLPSRGGIKQSINPPFTPYLGPWAMAAEGSNPKQGPGFENRVWAELLAALPRNLPLHLGCWPGIFPLAVLNQAGIQVGMRQTYRLNLREEEAQIWSGMSENLRRKLRKTASFEIRSTPPEGWGTLWSFLQSRLQRKGLTRGKDPEGMPQLLKTGRERDQIHLLGAYDGQDCLAMIWVAWDNEQAYYLAGGRNPQVPDRDALAHLLWKAVVEARLRGLSSFDFEGSMDPGVERFFQGFGAARSPYLVLHRSGPRWWEFLRSVRQAWPGN